MLKINQINLSNISDCFKLLFNDKKQFKYFNGLGWSKKQFNLQISKKNNCSFGLWQSNAPIGFLIGELIYVEKKSEYEILLLYVDKNFRNHGHATYLINALNNILKSNKILTITGDTSLVEGGEVSVGVMDNSGKMVITVNLPNAKAEGHAFAPSFLKLTKVIR